MIRNYFVTAFRQIFKNLSHSIVNVLGLGVGIACAILIMLWVNHEVSFDKFHKESDRLYQVFTTYKPSNGEIQTNDVFPVKLVDAISSNIPEVEQVTQLASGTRWPFILCFKDSKESTDACNYMQAVFVDPNFPDFFSFTTVYGDQSSLEDAHSIILTETKAQQLFPGQDAIGKSLVIDTWVEVKVGAVVQDPPANSTIQFEVVLPMKVFRSLRGLTKDSNFNEQWFQTYVKTRRATDLTVLNEKLISESQRSEVAKAEGIEFTAQSFTDVHLYASFDNGKPVGGRIDYVWIFSIIALLVLGIACINFINLSIARGATRGKEIGVRKVSGALRFNLVMQFLAEAFVLVLLSFIVGVAMAQLALPAFNLVIGEHLTLDLINGVDLYWLLGSMAVVTLASGFYPALVLSSARPIAALKNRSSETSSRTSLRRMLTIAQLAASIALIVYTSTLFLQLQMIKDKNLGYDRKGVIKVEPTYDLLMKFDAFKSELLKNPSVLNAALASDDPLDIQSSSDNVSWAGKPANEKIPFRMIACSNDFIETMNMKLIDGKGFNKEMPTEPNPIVLTEGALKIMNLDNPIGAEIKLFGETCVIVGVMEDIQGQSLHHTLEPTILILETHNERLTRILVRYAPGTTEEVLAHIKQSYDKIESRFSMVYWFMDDLFGKQYKSELVTTELTIFFTFIAIVIAMQGILGLSTFNVVRRIREIGVRKVFGATTVNILQMLTTDFVRLVFISCTIAFPLGYYASYGWLERFAYRVDIPWWLFAASLAIVLVSTIAVICIQAFRAATTNPSKILRQE